MITTALDFFQKGEFTTIPQLMIEFAQMHVKAALEKASEDAEADGGDGYGWVDKGSILDAYPLTNIK